MILDKTVSIKLTSILINKYNYNGESGDIIDINVSKLPKNSTKLLNVKCDICGNERLLEYRLYMKNYNKYNLYTCYGCSRIKYKKTSLKNYGVENPMQNEDIKKKFKTKMNDKYGGMTLESNELGDKVKQTNLKIYGVENAMQNIDIQNKMLKTKKEIYGENFELITDKIQNTKLNKYSDINYVNTKKIKLTNQKKYNCDYPLQNDNVYNKTIDTMFDKYGGHPMQNDIIKEKQIKSNIITTFNNIKEKYQNIKFISKENEIYTIMCDVCNKTYDISFNLFHLRKMNDITLCCNCNDPKNNNVSEFENKVCSFLDEYNINYIKNNRKILNGKELDIFIPDLNIAIECNGLYWHSELYKEKNYHKNKLENCKKLNIELLNIWEDDWVLRKEIIKSMLLNKLNKISNKIYARKCTIKKLTDNKIIKDFLNKNHIQGFVKSSTKIGLFYNDELVSLMTFGNRKTNGNKEFELIRFCNKINTNVIGGGGKLFKFFIKNNKNINIISYSDNSFFTGKIYKKLGFSYLNDTALNYYWIVNNNREHRFKYNKKKLVLEGNDPNKSEYEIMTEKGYYRLWSCGMKKWEFKNNR